MSEQTAIDFEIVGDVPLIESELTVKFYDNRFKKPIKFTTGFTREKPADAQQVLADILAKEQELEGSALSDYQEEQIRERLICVKGFPTSSGKKIDAGPDFEYSLDSLLDSLMTIGAYRTGLYQKMLNSLTERELFDAKRKN